MLKVTIDSKIYSYVELLFNLVHPLDQGVDVGLTVASVTTLHEVRALLDEATPWVGELERPEEGVDLLEVGSDSVDLVDDVLNANDTILAKVLLNHAVVSDGDALLVDLGKASLIDELPHGLEVGVAGKREPTPTIY